MSIPPEARPLVTCYCDTDMVHAADAVTGLIELANAGEIELQFRLRDKQVCRRGGVWTLWLRIRMPGGAEHGLCVDCHDSATYFCADSLAACTRYYKSNLGPGTYSAVPTAERNKLRPFGPYLPCRPRRDRAVWLRQLGNLYTKTRYRLFVSKKPLSVWQKLHRLAPELFRFRRYQSRKTWSEYESAPTIVTPPNVTIFFNPSCWDERNNESNRHLNELRAELIVGLRRELGERFIGGFRNYGPSVAKYPQAVEPRSIPHSEYVQLLQASPLTVYVNGVAECFSWRIAENFAASICMVSEPIPNDAGFPLDASAGIIQCNSPQEMIAEINRLCNSPEELRELATRSGRTYTERLRPHLRMRRILHELLCDRPAIDSARNVGETAAAPKEGAA